MAVNDPESVVPSSPRGVEPTVNRPGLAGLLRNAWTGKEIGADLGPEERRLYRQIPGNQGVPALPRLGYGGARFRPEKGGGKSAHDSRFRLSRTGFPGGRHGVGPRRR